MIPECQIFFIFLNVISAFYKSYDSNSNTKMYYLFKVDSAILSVKCKLNYLRQEIKEINFGLFVFHFQHLLLLNYSALFLLFIKIKYKDIISP